MLISTISLDGRIKSAHGDESASASPEPRGIEAIHAAQLSQMTRQSAKIAIRRNPFAVLSYTIGSDRSASELRMRGQKRRDLLFALFAFQRTDGKNQKPAGLDHRCGAFQKIVSQRGLRRD